MNNTNKKFGKIRGTATIIRKNGKKEDVDLTADKVTEEQFKQAQVALGLVKSQETKVTQ